LEGELMFGLKKEASELVPIQLAASVLSHPAKANLALTNKPSPSPLLAIYPKKDSHDNDLSARQK
jgi:hypothetical protein